MVGLGNLIFNNQFYEGDKITAWFDKDGTINLQFVNSSFKVCNGNNSLRFLDELEICLRKWKKDEYFHGKIISLHNLDNDMIAFSFENIGDIDLEKDDLIILKELYQFIKIARIKLDLSKHC